MQIKSIKYAQFEKNLKIWRLEGCTLGEINLLVGRNAAGKTKTLAIINSLANIFSGERKIPYVSGNYDVIFDNEGRTIEFKLHYEGKKVIKEELKVENEKKLIRGRNGIGRICFQKKGGMIEFQTPQDEVASVARRDSIQHPFLEELYKWGQSVRFYQFGTSLGREQFGILAQDNKNQEQQNLNLKNQNIIVNIFIEGQKKYGSKFVKSVIDDMRVIGFDISEIGISKPYSLSFVPALPSEVVEIYAKESDLYDKTEQFEMSQGMFRALSLIIQIRFSMLSGVPSCLVIDDIGEGLDFERASSLVGLLIKRTKNTSIQLVMSTNDRFIMNKVPLEYWSVIQRIGNISKVFNQRNSMKLFEDFKYTGLSNFDFFSSGYYLRDKN